MSFASIVGHDRPLKIITRALANNTLAHAYLFSGEQGIGKKMTALALAAAANCRNAGPDGGCGQCPSCRKVSAGEHPDVHVIAADGEEIKIDQVRQAQSDIALKPFEGAKKVQIIDGAEEMNTASANAFLKTLEEPPGDTLIILISSRPQGLLQTIRSRCQEIKFYPLSRRTLAQVLIGKRGLPEEDARFIAALARGSLGRALEMDADKEREAREELLALWERIGGGSIPEVLGQAEEYAKDKERLERLLDMGVEWLRDAVVYREAGDEDLLVHARKKDVLSQWADRYPVSRMLQDMELFDRSRRLLDRRVSAQLVAENLFLKLGRG